MSSAHLQPRPPADLQVTFVVEFNILRPLQHVGPLLMTVDISHKSTESIRFITHIIIV